MPAEERIPYTAFHDSQGEFGTRPLLTVKLIYRARSVTATGLVDSGSDVNVLPHRIAVALGLKWDTQGSRLRWSGNLGGYEAQPVAITVKVGNLPLTDLAFVWTQAEQAPLIFGQATFFDMFVVCFNRAEGYFSVAQPLAREGC